MPGHKVAGLWPAGDGCFTFTKEMHIGEGCSEERICHVKGKVADGGGHGLGTNQFI